MQTNKNKNKAQAAQAAQTAQTFTAQPLAQFMQTFAPQTTPIFIKYGSSNHSYIFYAITAANLQIIQANLAAHLANPIFNPTQAAQLTAYFAKNLQPKLNKAIALNSPLLLMLSPTTKQAYLFSLPNTPSWGLQYIHPAANFLTPKNA